MSKTKKISEIASKAAYMRGYISGPEWENVVGHTARGIFAREASTLHTSLTCIMANVFAGVFSILGPSTVIEIETGYQIQSNIYSLLVAASGSGKSHSYDRLFLRPLRQIEKEENIQIIMEEFTPVGFLKFLSENGGYAVFTSDEFCQIMRAKLSSRHEENQSFRSQLNKFYNGKGVSKVYGSKEKLQTDDVYLTIFGTTQPHPYATFHQDMSEISDSLASRFLVLCAAPIPEQFTANEHGNPIVGPANVDIVGFRFSDVVQKYYKAISALHNRQRPVTYRFTVEAKEFLDSLRKLQADAKKAAYQAAEQKMCDGTASIGDIPMDDSQEKDFEYIAKYSAILHVLDSTIVDGIQKNFRQMAISPLIPKLIVERAHALVTTMRSHQQQFIRAFEEVVTPIADVVQVQHVVGNDGTSIEKKILTFPGKVISSQMVVHKYRQIHARSMELPKLMRRLLNLPTDPNYVGQYHIIDKNKHVFFKAPPDKCDHAFLESLGITVEQYSNAYNADMAEPPCSGFSNWEDYYQKLLDSTPDNI